MIPMRVDQLAFLAAVLGERTNPAAPELVSAVVTAAGRMRQVGYPEARAMQLGRDVPAVVRRLVDAETALTTLRGLIADLVAEIDEGDELTTYDVRHRLASAGIRLDDEIADAAALRTARAVAGAL